MLRGKASTAGNAGVINTANITSGKRQTVGQGNGLSATRDFLRVSQPAAALLRKG
jgi:hypothetical protein